MEESRRRILMFHGTSDVLLPSIMTNGLLPDPPRRLSALMATGTGHTASFPGSYFTTRPSLADSYAKQAAKDFGGNGVVLACSLILGELVPDEDEIHQMLESELAWILGYDDERHEDPLRPWTMAAAIEAAESLARGAVNADIQAVADRLDAMIAPVTADWDRSPKLFHPDFNTDGWSSPEWVRKLTATTWGMAVYRENMDALTQLLAGMDPDSYPCEIESCKGRIRTAVRTDGSDRDNFIFAAGTIRDPACAFDSRYRLSGDEDYLDGCGDDCLDGYLPTVPAPLRHGAA